MAREHLAKLGVAQVEQDLLPVWVAVLHECERSRSDRREVVRRHHIDGYVSGGRLEWLAAFEAVRKLKVVVRDAVAVRVGQVAHGHAGGAAKARPLGENRRGERGVL